MKKFLLLLILPGAIRNTFFSNRPFVDELVLTQRLYRDLINEIDSQLRQHGFLPALNLLLTDRLSAQPYFTSSWASSHQQLIDQAG